MSAAGQPPADPPEAKKPADPGREIGRGREARGPSEIPASGWRDVLLRTKTALGEDNVGLISAAVAFYALMALFPGLGALVSMYGLVADPATVEAQLSTAKAVIPGEAWTIVEEQLRSLTGQPPEGLTLGAIAGLLVALFSARLAISSMMSALNVVYHESEERGILTFNATALLLTLGVLLVGVVAVLAIVAVPIALSFIGFGDFAETVVAWLRWPFMATVVAVMLSVLYRYGPSRQNARWQWVSWGSAIATLLWIAASLLFSWYVASFGSYNETYGSIGAVIVMLLWLYYSAFVVLLGAELNMQMEHQTKEDTTTGPEEPMGTRGAFAADTIGRVP